MSQSKSIKYLSVLLLLCLASATNVFAGNRIAFVVGINQYDNLKDYRQLENAVNDARAVAQELKGLGFDVIPGENLSRSEFSSKWQDILDRVGPDDTLAFFFSGHGVQIEGQNFILPRDIPYIKMGRQEQIKRESLSVSEMLLDLRTGDREPPRVTLMILDACRDNPMVPPGYKSIGGMGGLANISPPQGTFIMYSAAAGEIALDKLGENDPVKNSLYTRVLLPLMRKPGITLPDLAQELRRQVSRMAESADHKQQPAYFDQLKGEFCLVRCKASAWGYLVDLLTSSIYELKGDRVEVGRGVKQAGVSNDINFKNQYISRHHLMFRDRSLVEDLRSRNGTTINGKFLPYGQGHKVADGDILALANIKALRFSTARPKAPHTIPPNAWAVLINSESKDYYYLSDPEYSLRIASGALQLYKGRIADGVMNIRWQNKAEMLDIRDDWTILMTYKESDYDYNSYYFPNRDTWIEAVTFPLQFVKLSADGKSIQENGPSFQLIVFDPAK